MRTPRVLTPPSPQQAGGKRKALLVDASLEAAIPDVLPHVGSAAQSVKYAITWQLGVEEDGAFAKYADLERKLGLKALDDEQTARAIAWSETNKWQSVLNMPATGDSLDGVKALVSNLEKAPTTGQYHAQIAVYFTSNKRRSAVLSWFGVDVWCAPVLDWTAYVKYCQKDDTKVTNTKPLVWGHVELKPGSRTDIEQMHEAVKALVVDGKATDEVIRVVTERWPALALQHSGALPRFISSCRPKAVAAFEPIERFHKWKRDLLDIVTQEPDPRHIYFIVDEDGGAGKSHFARYMAEKHNWLVVGVGKRDDVAYTIGQSPAAPGIIIDVTRSQLSYWEHLASIAENCKDGVVFSPKYTSTTYTIGIKHVVIMVNKLPDGILSPDAEGKSLLSKDRVKVWRVWPDGWSAIMPPPRAAPAVFASETQVMPPQ